MKAIYNVPFKDFDYEGWAKVCGLTATHNKDDSTLRVEGSTENIDQFSNELSWKPVVVFAP